MTAAFAHALLLGARVRSDPGGTADGVLDVIGRGHLYPVVRAAVDPFESSDRPW